MKILFVSHSYLPDVGGIESMSELLVAGFLRAGHDVHVVTESEQPDPSQDAMLAYEVTRNPNIKRLYGLVTSCDVVFHNNVSMRMAWPLIFSRKPWVVSTHTWIRRNDGRRSFVDAIKVFLMRFASLISASQALALDLGHESVVVPNAYDNRIFTRNPRIVRQPGSIVFVGRLVSAKGVDVLLHALKQIESNGDHATLTVIGEGSQRGDLEALASSLGLEGRVTFRGILRGSELAEELNRHQIMAIPSVWSEPFGVVALEGAACGLALVATEGGGLPEAVGPCGLTVANGDHMALADALHRLLFTPKLASTCVERSESHLARHTPEAMVKGYLSVIDASLSGHVALNNRQGSGRA